MNDLSAPSTFPKGLVALANAEKPPVVGLGIAGVFGVVEGVVRPKTEDRPKTGVVVEGAGDVVTGVSKADTFAGVVVRVVCTDLKNGEFLSGAPKTLSPSERVDCLRLANAPPMGDDLSALGFPRGDGEGLRSNGDEDVTPMVVGGLGSSGEEAGDGANTSCSDLLGVLDSGFGRSRRAVRSDFSRGAKTGFDSGLDPTWESPSFDCMSCVDAEGPGASREDVALLHAPKPPAEGVIKEDGVGVPNEVWTRVDVDPNAGCPKAGVDFVPKPVCTDPEAGFREPFCVSDGEDVSSLAWFQLENAPKPGLTVEEPKADVEEGWVAVTPNKPPWSFP